MSNSNSIPYLPFEVIASEILPKLDIKTLVRCISVCKLWNSLITNPYFINSSINNTNESLLVQTCHKQSPDFSNSDVKYRCQDRYSLHYDSSQLGLIRLLKNPPIERFNNRTTCFVVVGTCNGLVCLVNNLNHSNTFILWNPAIRKYVLLPRLDDDVLRYERSSVGFGFDSKTSDFKVVVLGNVRKLLHKVWVCSLAARSWKPITVSKIIPPCSVPGNKPHVFANGKLHCVARHSERKHNFILTIDVENEVFGEIELPERLKISEEYRIFMDYGISVFVIGDSIAVSWVDTAPFFSVWVMREYGVVESWTKVGTKQGMVVPNGVLVMMKNGELIMRVINDGQIRRYDPTSETLEDVEVRGDRVFIGYHKESLYLLDKGEGLRSYTY